MKIPTAIDLVIWGVIAACGLGLVLVVKGWHDDALELPNARASLADSEAARESERASHAHDLKIAKDASDEYQAELSRIRAGADLGVVRLCKPARMPARAVTTGTATGSHAEATRHVEEPHADDPGPDIGPALSDFVEDCESNAAQLDKLQVWARSR